MTCFATKSTLDITARSLLSFFTPAAALIVASACFVSQAPSLSSEIPFFFLALLQKRHFLGKMPDVDAGSGENNSVAERRCFELGVSSVGVAPVFLPCETAVKFYSKRHDIHAHCLVWRGVTELHGSTWIYQSFSSAFVELQLQLLMSTVPV